MLRTLRSRLVLSHVALVLLALTIVAFYSMRTVNFFHLVFMQSRMRDEMAILTERLGPDMAAGNRAGIAAYLAGIGSQVDFTVLVADGDGTIIGSTEPEDAHLIGRPGLAYGLSRALLSRIEMIAQADQQPDTDLVYLVSPIEREGKPVGFMRLSYRLTNLYSELDQLTTIILMGAAGAGGLAILLSVGLAQGLSASARGLASAAHALSAGNLSHRIRPRGRDEISDAGRAFDDLADRLQQLEWARQQLLGDVSHDLHSSITGVAMAVEALQRGAADDLPTRDLLLDGLASHCRRLRRMADDLLEAARIEGGRLRLQRQKVSPSAMLRGVAAEFAAEAAGLGVSLDVQSGTELPAIMVDGDRLTQALGNLVENAIRCAPRGSSVTLGGSVQEAECHLTVQDEGPGIPEQELATLFDRFKRYAEGRPGRLGIGLAIAKGLVEAHGGRIEVASFPGKGTLFSVVLPLAGDLDVPIRP